MIQSVSFSSAAFEAFAKAYLYFSVSSLVKKIKIKKKRSRGIQILRNHKKSMSPRINFFFLKKEKQCFA